jgi:phosphate transport system ATP-binding protein
MENIKIAVSNFNLFFGAKHVLKNIHIEFPANKIIALIGPSGCGKSTLLRSLNRMHDLTPDARLEGEIRLDDLHILHPRTDVVTVRRKVGMVFQRPNPFPKSIYENVAYGLRLNGTDQEDSVREKVESCLRQSYIWEETKDELQKSALQLSGGQQQRLCIARAIAVEPEVILLDEPCSALDPISTAKIEDLLLELKNRYTIIIVTHNMQQAQRVADFTAFMYLGEVIEYAPTEQLFKNPQQMLTRNYVEGHFG